MRTSLFLDEKEREALEKFPGRVSMSAIVRCFLMAASTTDGEWQKLLEKEPDIARARDSIKARMRSLGKKGIVL